MTAIGVLGGTFDPVHIGHLVAAVDAGEGLGLDRVLLVVAGEPWQKAGEVAAPARHRLAMVEAAVAGVGGLAAEGCEVARKGPSYTVDTLEELRGRFPGDELVLLLGADAAAGLESWHRAAELPSLATLAVFDRPAGGAAGGPPPGWAHRRVPTRRLDVSSRELRDRLATGRSVEWLVPGPVLDYIRAHGLYGSGDSRLA